MDSGLQHNLLDKGVAMDTQNTNDNPVTRRALLGGSAALAAGSILPRGARAAGAAKPNSVFNGVRIGCITYSYRGEISSAEDTLKALIEDSLSEVELMDGPIRSYTGMGGEGRRGAGRQPTEPADEQRQAQLARCAELRKMYNDAGVNIHIHKIGFGQSDEAIDFNFRVAKALGCVGITLERSEPMARKLAPFADRHKIWIAFHNHTNNYPVMDKPDPILDYGQYVGFNLDVGHYFAGTKGRSPLPVLEKYHDRIVSLHLKDRTADGGNVPWGMGGTPIKEILQLMKKEKWTFPADIEVEYKIPEGSSAVAEVARCVRYCKEALA
jgi:sugar phosphate isomerase/epimerase